MVRRLFAAPRSALQLIRRATWRQWLLVATGSAMALVAAAVGAFALVYASIELPDEPAQVTTSVVYDAAGNKLAELYKDENRVDVPLDRIAPVLRSAVLAAEDRNFYEHDGVDPVGLTRALVNDVRGRSLQGGSTITQQLVKNVYLSPERSLDRKVKEAVLALKIERQTDKDVILERYLNTVYFGRGAYGAEKAAQHYFGRSAIDLDLPQAALLAGLIRRPETAEPSTHLDEAKRRRTVVLNALERDDVIDSTEAFLAGVAPIEVIPAPDPETVLTGSSAYFVSEVREWATETFGEKMAFGGGLRIETTLDPRMQAAAERAVFGTLDRSEDPDASLVALADDGAIVAMIGGRDFQESKVNLAVGRDGGGIGRQPGSTFKPMVLAAALTEGIPVTQRYAGPSTMNVKFPGEPDYPVHNYGKSGFGTLDLMGATASSVNTVYAQLAADTGMQNVVETAHDLGVSSKLEPYPSLTLGALEVSPLEMTRAYMTFANRGERVTPFYVRKVTAPDGTVVFDADPERERVYPQEYADLMNHVLRNVIVKGTGKAANIGRPAAGKTGTTQDNTDAWFVGYTPKLGAAVWMGYKEDTFSKMNNVHGRAVTGGSFPAQIWQRFMSEAVEGLDTGDFVAPSAALLKAKPLPRSRAGGQSPAPRPPELPPEAVPTESAAPVTTVPATTPATTAPPKTTPTTVAPPATTTTTAPAKKDGPKDNAQAPPG